jgi:UDP-glucose:(heptosyl)LPS alpha-1,3-glucosyltransferase
VKIALVHKKLDLNGGTERDLFRTAEGLRDLGHDVHLFCGEYGVSLPVGTSAHRVPIVPLGRTLRLWSFALFAPRLLRRTPCDVVVNFGRLLSQDVLRSGGGSHRAFLHKLGQSGGLLRQLWQWASPYHQSLLAMEQRQFQRGHYQGIVAVSDEVKRELMATYAVPENRIAVIYNGVDHERFRPALRQEFRESVRKQWQIPPEALTVLFVGSGFRRKGLDHLLAVWDSPKLKEVYLLVVGEDARRDRYGAWAERQGQGRVIFTGRQAKVERYYGAADLVALPAVQEAFGNVVLEALASGLPVVVSRTVGAAEVLKGRLVNGIVIDPKDPREIVTKLVSMLEESRDPNLRMEARKLGEEYSWKNHFLKLQVFLQRVVEQRRCESCS